jgi:ribose transport system substrate-binding protein
VSAYRARARAPRAIAAIAAVTCAALGLAACTTASSSTTASTAASNGSSSGSGKPACGTAAQLAASKATVAKLSQPPSSIGVTTPLAKRPAKGTVIAYIAPSGPTGTSNGTALVNTAKSLGYTVKEFFTGSTADDFQTAFNSAAAANPAAVWVSAIQPSTWSSWGNKWNAAGIPVVNQGNTTPTTAVNRFDFGSVEKNNAIEEPLADWVYADSGGTPADTLVVDPSDIALFAGAATAIQSRLKTLCPGSAVDVLNSQLANVGTTIPSQVSGYVSSHPNTKYIIFDFADLATGVPEALASAGQTGIKIVVAAADQAIAGEVKSGKIAVNLAYDLNGQADIVLDFMMRSLEKQSTTPDQAWNFPTQFQTSATIGDPNVTFSIPDEVSKWSQLWGVSGS